VTVKAFWYLGDGSHLGWVAHQVLYYRQWAGSVDLGNFPTQYCPRMFGFN